MASTQDPPEPNLHDPQALATAQAAARTHQHELDQQDAKQWIDNNEIWTDTGYDFLPMATALIETLRDKTKESSPPDGTTAAPSPRPATAPSPRPATTSTSALRPNTSRSAVISSLTLRKNTGSGSGSGERYVPPWTAPDYTDGRPPRGTIPDQTNTTRDAFYNLRPALRPEDNVRNPTDYALRFGIAEGRVDGRSRMSPSWSKTRNSIVDTRHQAHQLNEEQRQRAVELSNEIYRKINRVPPPGEEIVPGVVDKVLAESGLLSNEDFLEEVRQAAEEKGMSLDEMVSELRQQNPSIMKAHKRFLNVALLDQDYQRMMLGGLTTDELIQDQIHVLDDDFEIELDNDIHAFFDRNKWHERGERFYTVDGVKASWNAKTNDNLWSAIQPAARLASQILSRANPPQLDAIYNMLTRQPVTAAENFTNQNNPPIHTRYVLEKDIDLSKTYPSLRELEERHKFNWKENVNLVLAERLRVCITSGADMQAGQATPYMEAWGIGTHGRLNTRAHTNPRSRSGPDLIDLDIPAEIVYPLLVPQYTKSEKMACLFVIANTLIHELAHAIASAQRTILTTATSTRNKYTPEITRLLSETRTAILGPYNQHTAEPIFTTHTTPELGLDIEVSLWGQALLSIHSISSRPDTTYPYHHAANAPLFVIGKPYPDIHIRRTTTTNTLPITNPISTPHRPLPLLFLAKVFQSSFWQIDIPLYGPTALKMMPDAHIQKVLSRTTPSHFDASRSRLGESVWRFCDNVCKLLSRSGQHILSTYLRALRWERWHRDHAARTFAQEYQAWGSGVYDSLYTSVAEARRGVLKDAEDLFTASEDEGGSYDAYVRSRRPGDVVMGMGAWQGELETQFEDMFRRGGTLMRALVDIHSAMQRDIGSMERLVFNLLSVREGDEVYFLFDARTGEPGPVGLTYLRMKEYQAHARDIMAFIDKIHESNRVAMQSEMQKRWDQWRERFHDSIKQYEFLILKIAQNSQIDPADSTWKKGFKRIPSGDWKRVSEQYHRMAVREYRRIHPDVRKVIDDYIYYVHRPDNFFSAPDHGLNPLRVETGDDDLTAALTFLKNLSSNQPQNPGFAAAAAEADSDIIEPPPPRPLRRRVLRTPQSMPTLRLRNPIQHRPSTIRDQVHRLTNVVNQISGFHPHHTTFLTSPDLISLTQGAQDVFIFGLRDGLALEDNKAQMNITLPTEMDIVRTSEVNTHLRKLSIVGSVVEAQTPVVQTIGDPPQAPQVPQQVRYTTTGRWRNGGDSLSDLPDYESDEEEEEKRKRLRKSQ